MTGAMQTVTNRTYINTSSVMELLGKLRLLHSGSTIRDCFGQCGVSGYLLGAMVCGVAGHRVDFLVELSADEIKTHMTLKFQTFENVQFLAG